MSKDNNIMSIVPKKDSDLKVAVKYIDESFEYIKCDEFVQSQALPGFIEFWRIEPDTLIKMINSSFIHSVTPQVVNDE